MRVVMAYLSYIAPHRSSGRVGEFGGEFRFRTQAPWGEMAGSGPGRIAVGSRDRGLGGHAMTYLGGRYANGDLSQPLRRKPRRRRYMVLDALVSVVVIGLAVVTVVILRGGTTSNSPVGTVAAGAQAVSNVTKGSKWLDGSGVRMLTAVNADMGKISTARPTGSDAAVRAAGAQLAADASAALSAPMPPVDAGVYQSALNDLRAAGSDDADGRFGAAARPLAQGRAGIMKVTAAADLPVKAKTPVIVEPNGQ